MIVREIMNRNVIVAKKDITTKEASQLMSQMGIGCLIIMEDDEIAGIITKSDILRAIAKDKKPDATLAEEIMSSNVITIDPDKSIEDAVDLMIKNNIKKLPVVDKKKIVGIITASDIAIVEPKLITSIANLLSIQPGSYKGG